MKKLFFVFVLLNSIILAQDSILIVDNYHIILNGSTLSISIDDQLKYEKKFNSPVAEPIDLNSDDYDELIIEDHKSNNGANYYWLYVINLKDSIVLTDSIYSGLAEPDKITSKELDDAILLTTGTPQYDSLNTSDEIFSPVNFWKYESDGLYSVNDDVYDLFISENEDIITYLDDFFKDNLKDCSNSLKKKNAIAAVFVNYLNADELSLGIQFLKEYYFCSDLESFKTNLSFIKEE